MKIAALVYQGSHDRSVGPELAQGIIGAVPFYWNMNDGARAFAARFTRPFTSYYHAGVATPPP